MNHSFTAFERCLREPTIDVAAGGTPVRLAPSFLLTNESGVRGDLLEKLSETSRYKVRFTLPSGRPADAATLLWFVDWIAPADGSRPPWLITVNGQVFEHRHDVAQMLTGGWDRLDVPADVLREGENEVVFAGHGTLRLDPGPGGRSARSFDGGRTWHLGAFGPQRDQSGELLVRLRVRGFPATGRIASPVIDLGDPDDSGRLVPPLSIRRVAATVAADVPAGSALGIEMRSGTSPAFDPACWHPWAATAELQAPARFVQWRLTLSTTRLDETPVVHAVELVADIGVDASASASYAVLAWERPALDRSSYAFTSLEPHLRTTRLVEQYRLDRAVAAGQTSFERLKLLAEWVYAQWYGWQGQRYPYCPSWDPLEILDVVKGNWGFGMCTHYAAALAGCAAALGYASRCVIVDHHCIAEVWVAELDKWILLDAGMANDSWAVYELDGQPINALEAHRAVLAGRADDLREHLYPQDVVQPMRKALTSIFCRFGIALRNNHLTAAAPAEHEHGKNQYHWDGYLWWTDDADPRYPEYSLQTQREADLYWTVGKVRIHLQIVDDLGHLEARLEHAMPNFHHFEARLNGNAWTTVDAVVPWMIFGNASGLEVRAVDAFGNSGPSSSVRVRRGPAPKQPAPERPVGGSWGPKVPTAQAKDG